MNGEIMRFLLALTLIVTAFAAPGAFAEVVGIAEPWQLGFQDAASPVMEQFAALHDYLLVIITAIVVFVFLLMVYVCFKFSEKKNPNPSKTTHNAMLEVAWTAIPVLILVAIAVPSLKVHFDYVHGLGTNEELGEADVTLKVIGYQWYWNYEYPEEGIQFDSYMKKDDELEAGEPRLLAVDNPIVVPVNKNVRVLVTGGDVLHSFAMPAFGVKQDTVPGRLNETWFRATKEGIYYGQCSELCGRLHGFMPIEIRVVSEEAYAAWLEVAKQEFAKADFGTTTVATAAQ